MHEQFKINSGTNYQRNQRGLAAAIAAARETAARYNETIVVYFGSDNYGYWCKPLHNCPAKFAEVTAREVCYVYADGSLRRWPQAGLARDCL